MTAKDIDIYRQIAHVRIHVERVIERLKKLKVLNVAIPIDRVDLRDNIIFSIFWIVKLNTYVVYK